MCDFKLSNGTLCSRACVSGTGTVSDGMSIAYLCAQHAGMFHYRTLDTSRIVWRTPIISDAPINTITGEQYTDDDLCTCCGEYMYNNAYAYACLCDAEMCLKCNYLPITTPTIMIDVVMPTIAFCNTCGKSGNLFHMGDTPEIYLCGPCMQIPGDIKIPAITTTTIKEKKPMSIKCGKGHNHASIEEVKACYSYVTKTEGTIVKKNGISCGSCKSTHATVAEVKSCYQGNK